MTSKFIALVGRALAVVRILLIALSAGCISEHSSQARVLSRSAILYEQYEAGDVNQARRSLEQLTDHFESPAADVLEPIGHASINYFNYARLYALETRVGSEHAAELALIKARYWNVRRHELRGTITNLEEIRLYNTPEKIMEVADRLDRATTNGKGPRYIQEIQKR